jgi:hypothetical protein
VTVYNIHQHPLGAGADAIVIFCFKLHVTD